MMQELIIREHSMINKFCPYFSDPSNDCYCNRITGQKIKNMLHFCRKYFDSCEIFISRSH
jgi:hypothetical protein